MGASAHRLHRHVEYPTVADAVIETKIFTKNPNPSTYSTLPLLPSEECPDFVSFKVRF